jgi:hypothetical protein
MAYMNVRGRGIEALLDAKGFTGLDGPLYLRPEAILRDDLLGTAPDHLQLFFDVFFDRQCSQNLLIRKESIIWPLRLQGKWGFMRLTWWVVLIIAAGLTREVRLEVASPLV